MKEVWTIGVPFTDEHAIVHSLTDWRRRESFISNASSQSPFQSWREPLRVAFNEGCDDLKHNARTSFTEAPLSRNKIFFHISNGSMTWTMSRGNALRFSKRSFNLYIYVHRREKHLQRWRKAALSPCWHWRNRIRWLLFRRETKSTEGQPVEGSAKVLAVKRVDEWINCTVDPAEPGQDVLGEGVFQIRIKWNLWTIKAATYNKSKTSSILLRNNKQQRTIKYCMKNGSQHAIKLFVFIVPGEMKAKQKGKRKFGFLVRVSRPKFKISPKHHWKDKEKGPIKVN